MAIGGSLEQSFNGAELELAELARRISDQARQLEDESRWLRDRLASGPPPESSSAGKFEEDLGLDAAAEGKLLGEDHRERAREPGDLADSADGVILPSGPPILDCVAPLPPVETHPLETFRGSLSSVHSIPPAFGSVEEPPPPVEEPCPLELFREEEDASQGIKELLDSPLPNSFIEETQPPCESEQEMAALPSILKKKGREGTRNLSFGKEASLKSTDSEKWDASRRSSGMSSGRSSQSSVQSAVESSVYKVLPVYEQTRLRQRNVTTILPGAALEDHFVQDCEDEVAVRPRLVRGEVKQKLDHGFTCAKCMARMVLSPSCPTRFVWDVASLALMGYEAFWLPMQFFDPATTGALAAWQWITRVFWTLDLFLNFFTGYLAPDGTIVISLRGIAKRYASSWLAIDLLVVGMDWADAYLLAGSGSSGTQAVGAMKTLKFIRTLRLLRLMRLMKMPAILSAATELIQAKIRNEQFFFVGKILRIVLFTILWVHFSACSWYAIGNSQTNSSWVYVYGLKDRPLDQRYLTSFHWALSQFAGTMEVNPQTTPERAFAVIMLLLAWLIAAGALSLITTAMTVNSFSNAQQSLQLARLRRYLDENDISRKLAVRITRNAKYCMLQHNRSTTETDVTLLAEISKPLRIELHFEVHAPLLFSHPFFHCLSEKSPAAMRKICHTTCSNMSISSGDVLFSDGEVPSVPQMYFVVSGELKYLQGVQHRPRLLGQGMWFCEANLWTKWIHNGTLKSVGEVSLLVVDTTEFAKIAVQFAEHCICVDQTNGRQVLAVNEYAHLFVRYLQEHEGMAADIQPALKDVICFVEQAFYAGEYELEKRHTVRESISLPQQPPEINNFGFGRRTMAAASHAIGAHFGLKQKEGSQRAKHLERQITWKSKVRSNREGDSYRGSQSSWLSSVDDSDEDDDDFEPELCELESNPDTLSEEEYMDPEHAVMTHDRKSNKQSTRMRTSGVAFRLPQRASRLGGLFH